MSEELRRTLGGKENDPHDPPTLSLSHIAFHDIGRKPSQKKTGK